MWVSLTADDLLRSLTGPERTAVQRAATEPGQADPLETILADVVKEVRGYVAAYNGNTLGEGDTIPDELRGAAVARARFEAFTRLPVGRSLLTEDRVEANRSAVAVLRDVAAGRFRLVQPSTASTEEIGAPSPRITPRTRTFDRASQDGV